jgi:hypothetical protein
MKILKIQRETIEKYLQTNPTENEDAVNLLEHADFGANLIEFDPSDLSDELLRFIVFNDSNLSNEDKTLITKEYFSSSQFSSIGNHSLWNMKIKTFADFWRICENLKSNTYNADVEYIGRKYPVKMIISLHNATRMCPRHINFSISLSVCNILEDLSFKIENTDIQTVKREIGIFTFEKLMSIYKVFKQEVSISAYNKTLEASIQLQKENGLQINCKGIGLEYSYFSVFRNKTLNSIHLDYFEKHSTAIVEGTLELEDENSHRSINQDFRNKTKLPFIRVFSLLYKKYIFVHIEDVFAYKYDEKAFNKLFLPKDLNAMIQKVFSYSLNKLSGDILNYKHGGLILMAEGNPGVGKTSTAEVYSELNKKPLYVVHVHEIGTNIEAIERNLAIIFKRVEKWEAIILFDEIDVFLSKRNDNIEKSAVVGVFLRLMDYFRGIMFLTTNRSEVIDPAVLSRITLNIKYPDFTIETRRKVWTSKLQDAKLKIDSLENLIQLNLNGRQIRNMIRLGKIIFTENIVEAEYIELIKKTVPDFEQDLVGVKC